MAGKGQPVQSVEARGQKIKETISVSASSTEDHTIDLPDNFGNITNIRVTATSGTTDTDIALYDNQQRRLQDQVFRAVNISKDDAVPTGGKPGGTYTGIPYNDENDNTNLYVQTTENSGNSGNLEIEIRFV